MSKLRYILSPDLIGTDYYSPNGKIELREQTSQADLQYLSEKCGMQGIQKGAKPMSLAEEVKVAEAELKVLKSRLAKQ